MVPGGRYLAVAEGTIARMKRARGGKEPLQRFFAAGEAGKGGAKREISGCFSKIVEQTRLIARPTSYCKLG